VIATGLAAAPGAAAGSAVFDPGRATELAAAGQAVVLFRPTTSPGDVAGFIAARAVVTGRGGRTSHAAVVARGMHRPAVCGIGDLKVSADRKSAELDVATIREGDLVSVDGDRGLVARGEFPLGVSLADPAVQRFCRWCEERCRVPRLTPAEVDALPAVDTLADLAARTERVVLVLEDPACIPAVDLAKALEQRTAAAPVLRLGEAWLRAADVRLRGHVAGLVVPDGLLSALLLQATLEPADAS
jgi:pyruvate,orthophosphate dikinase